MATRSDQADWQKPWNDFVADHQGHPALTEEVVYALPQGCAERLAEQKVLSREEMVFELDLARASGSGFFLRRPFNYLGLAEGQRQAATEPLDAQFEKSRKAIHDMLVEDLVKGGADEQLAEYWLEDLAEPNPHVEELRRAYAGWLVTNAEYRREEDNFCRAWADAIRRYGMLPEVPQSFVGGPVRVPKKERAFYSAYMEFYCRWGVERLATWELPVPLQPQIARPTFYSLPQIGGAGLTLFLPWALLRDKDLKIEELVRPNLRMASAGRLFDWLNRVPKNVGVQSYALVLDIYLILELCLKRRYPKAVKRNLGKIDLAISQMHKGKEDDGEKYKDSVRKMRLFMQRQLKT